MTLSEKGRNHVIARTDHALREAGINTVEQLTEMTSRQLLQLPNIGPKSVRFIRDRLAARDLSLKDDDHSNVSYLLRTQDEPEVVSRRKRERAR